MVKRNYMRRFAPLFAGIVVICLFLSLWYALRKNERDHLHAKIELKAVNVKIEILRQVSSQTKALIRMANRWETGSPPTRADWEADAALYVEHNPFYQAVEWVDDSFHVRWIMPLKGNEAAQDVDLSFEEKRRTAMQEALKTRKATITEFVDFVQGGKGFLVFAPIFRVEKFEGFIVGVFRIDKLLKLILDERLETGVFIALYDGDQQIYQSGSEVLQGDVEWARDMPIAILGATWRLWVWPDAEFLKAEKTFLPDSIFAFGALVSFLLALSLHLRQKAQGREKVIEAALVITKNYNENLMKEITERKRAEGLLDDSGQRVKALVNNMVDAFVLIDERGVIEEFNPAAERIFGYEAQEAIGKNVKMLMPEPHASAHDGYIERYIRTGEARIIGIGRELNGLRKDGNVFPMDLTITEVYSGGKRSFIGIVRDITMRKEMENQLQKLSNAVEQNPTPIVITDVEGRIEYINSSFTQSTGYSLLEVIGKTPRIFKSGKHPPEFYKNLWDTILAGKTWTGDFCNRRKDGSFYWELKSVSPIRTVNGAISHFISVRIDDTERKLAEENLRFSEERSRRIIETANDAFISIDEGGLIREWSGQAEKVFGWQRSEVMGKLLADFIVPEKFREEHLNGLKRFLATKQGKVMNQRLEMTALHRKGHEFPVEMSISPMPYKDSYRFNAFINDVTDKKAMQVELGHAQKMESIGQLAAGIAHEINTPMQFIGDNSRFLMDSYKDIAKVLESYRQLLETCRNGRLASETVENVENLMREVDLDYLLKEIPQAIDQSLVGVERVSKIVRAMKEFSHPGETEKKSVDLNKVIETTVTVSKNEWKYVAEVKLDLDPDLPLVSCFRDDIHQVILNLVVNAAHAIGDVVGKNESGKGTITISTRRQKTWADIRVSDTGTGIPENIRAKIFDPFFTTKPVGKGTGQGLSIIHAIVVKKHQGTIAFETAMGKGTTFIVLLPIFPASEKGQT